MFDLTIPRDEGSQNYPWRGVGMVNLIGEDYEIEEFNDLDKFEYPTAMNRQSRCRME